MRKGPPPVPKATAVDNLVWQVKHLAGHIPYPTHEYRFHQTRDYRFDLCWPVLKVAIEVDGGIWNYGRHNRAAGMVKDMQKGNEAVVCGYRVLHFRPEEIVTAKGRMIEDALKVIVRVFEELGYKPGGNNGRQAGSSTADRSGNQGASPDRG